RGRPPGRPSRLDEIDPVASGSRGTRADQGVCPTISAEFSQVEKRAALGYQPAPRYLSTGTSPPVCRGGIAAETLARVAGQRIDVDVFDGSAVVFVVTVHAAAPGSLPNIDPVGGPVAGSTEALGIHQRFQQ